MTSRGGEEGVEFRRASDGDDITARSHRDRSGLPLLMCARSGAELGQREEAEEMVQHVAIESTREISCD
jgi:hypothetical protein